MVKSSSGYILPEKAPAMFNEIELEYKEPDEKLLKTNQEIPSLSAQKKVAI